jgi:hypothetical protein
MLPYADLHRPAVRGLLRRFGLSLTLAVRPWDLQDLGDLLPVLAGDGIAVGLWPMLADGDGRWASVASWTAFERFLDTLLLSLSPRLPEELVLDLEPPFSRLEAWKDGRLALLPRASHGAYARTAAAMTATVERLRARGVRVRTAILPFLVFDAPMNPMHRLLGTPALEIPADAHSLMAYTSLFEGWSRGALDRRRAESLLYGCARGAARRLGDGASVSLGVVGTGAFGDEPTFRSPEELARDVALVRAAGISDIALFDLAGVLSRPPAEGWLDAFASEEVLRPEWIVSVSRVLRRLAARSPEADAAPAPPRKDPTDRRPATERDGLQRR